jgi:hypothetical protein
VLSRYPVYPEIDLNLIQPADFGLEAFEVRGAG